MNITRINLEAVSYDIMIMCNSTAQILHICNIFVYDIVFISHVVTLEQIANDISKLAINHLWTGKIGVNIIARDSRLK